MFIQLRSLLNKKGASGMHIPGASNIDNENLQYLKRE